jgi:hypothetical protein
MQRRVNNPEV